MAKQLGAILPDSNSPAFVLRHPTPAEQLTISTNTSASWSDSLSLPLYLEESLYLATVPLAKDGGMTSWILVDKHLPPGQRQILCSCESFWKPCLTSDTDGKVSENVVHGIASVFCPLEYRNRGYTARMMKELAKELYTWQTVQLPCVGSVLYSDIGKEYYAKLGWLPNTTNSHVEIQPKAASWPTSAKQVLVSDLEKLCKRDEIMVRKAMAMPTADVESRMTIIPSLYHMLWHLSKEEFACNYLFGRVPSVKGAIAGRLGSQVWAFWTHRYYGRHDVEVANNVLYILRLVMEVDNTATRLPSDAEKRPNKELYDEQLQKLKAVLQAAQAEAAEWKLDVVKLWDPTPLVRNMLNKSGFEYEIVEREQESIASLLWYDSVGGVSDAAPLWINNEHYAWC